MKPLRLQSSARLFTVVLLMMWWLVATNHCSLGLMKQTGAAHAKCCGRPAPEKQAPKDGTRECCRAIQGTQAPEKVGEKFEGPQAGFELLALLEVLALPSADRRLGSFVFDDRPARAASFAESVLQRSLLGHAPPFAV